ncbi:MAG: uracil-DNA glycosylase [Betaproteobacteria bacterium]|nr:uracil-DNA glycosylase [Betaproteobacteria bacterium]
MKFSLECRDCPRLAGFLDQVRHDHPDYHARPVAPFGDASPQLLVVGLAPGMHGANRTGRPFTGDHAGILLYQTLHRFGFATAAQSLHAADGLRLAGCRLTNAVKCVPPQNKPELSEIGQCNRYLQAELETLTKGTVVLALGTIAHQAVLLALAVKKTLLPFRHGARYELANGLTLYDSYHCSRYNTQTKRLTESMFNQVFSDIVQNLSKNRPSTRPRECGAATAR